MDAYKICLLILCGFVVFGLFVLSLSCSVIWYREHKKKSKLLERLCEYYEFYHPALLSAGTRESKLLADDIYFVSDKRFSHNECEQLAELLIAIGYTKKDGYDPTKGLF